MKNTLWVIIVFLLTPFSSALAWEDHHSLMENMVRSQAGEQRNYLNKEVALPTLAKEKEVIHQLAETLHLNEAKVPLFMEHFSAKKTSVPSSITVRDILLGSFIDEPDQGMDQDLPDSADLLNERAWMGGKTGPTSQGFRHMFFAGMELRAPFASLQIPTHPIGQAPVQYEKLRAESAKFFKEGNLFWGLRTLLWSLHLVQDLHQPFHVTQVPSLQMLPWKNLFSGFVASSTQAMANYHYAFEGLVLEYIRESNINAFQDCFDVKLAKPVIQISEIISATRKQSSRVGDAVYLLFGNYLKSPEVNLPLSKGEIDYYALIHEKDDLQLKDEDIKELKKSDVMFIRNQIERVTGLKQVQNLSCELMRELSTYTWGELDSALK